jgi:F-type H+-transporting ATPase subunit delta
MAESITIARPYAEAVFRLAKEKDSLRPWSEALAFMAGVVRDPQVQALIGNPKLTTSQVEALLLAVSDGRLDEQGNNFIKILIENRRLSLLPEISELFEELKAQQEGMLEAKITSAFPLADQELRSLIERLEKKCGRAVEAQVSVDPELIGGVKVEIGDEVWDASVRSQLEAMAFALTR